MSAMSTSSTLSALSNWHAARPVAVVLALVSLAVAAMVPAAPVRAADSPADPIRAIYKRVAAGKGEDGGNFVWQDKKGRARWLSAAFARAWDAAEAATPKGDETPPGFDPVSASQDPKVRNVTIAVERSDAATATVAAAFDGWSPGSTHAEQERNAPDPKARITVRYDMVRERGRWRIDDMRGSVDGKPWSIRAIFKVSDGR